MKYKTVKNYLFILLMSSCSAPHILLNFWDWDMDKNHQVDKAEFISGYAQSGFLLKWTKGERLSYLEFNDGVFKSLDINNDLAISPREFHIRHKQIYLGPRAGEFNDWDTNEDTIIHYHEFTNRINQLNLARSCDTSSDEQISRDELVIALFNIADLDNDKRLDELEFNIWEVNR